MTAGLACSCIYPLGISHQKVLVGCARYIGFGSCSVLDGLVQVLLVVAISLMLQGLCLWLLQEFLLFLDASCLVLYLSLFVVQNIMPCRCRK